MQIALAIVSIIAVAEAVLIYWLWMAYSMLAGGVEDLLGKKKENRELEMIRLEFTNELNPFLDNYPDRRQGPHP